MVIEEKNPLKLKFRLLWIGFAAMFVSVIAFGFAIHHATKPVLNQLSQQPNPDPAITQQLLNSALLTPLPVLAGLAVIVFTLWFILSGIAFLIHALRLLLGKDG